MSFCVSTASCREILEYHPQVLSDYERGVLNRGNFQYPSALDNFKRQFAHLEGGGERLQGPQMLMLPAWLHMN